MRKHIISILQFVILFIVAIVFYSYGKAIPITKQIPLYDSLRTTSAIIFAVMGAWMAVIYPGILSKLFTASVSMSDYDKDNIERLLSPLIYSSVIIAIVLVVTTIAPLLQQIQCLVNNTRIMRGLSYSVLGMLTLTQLWTLLLTLIPGDYIKRNIDTKYTKTRLIDKYQSRVQKQ